MKIAIIGGGISGLAAAYYLRKGDADNDYEVTVFEKNDYIGGHTATKEIEYDGRRYAIDTGFIVYNDWTYPNFIGLLDELGVATQETSMGFSVSDLQRDYEYSGGNLDTLFAQRSNLFSVSHWLMLRDILRFNKEAITDYEAGLLSADESLGDYLVRKGYSDAFRDYYLCPMGAAIWSSSLVGMLDFSVLFFVRFFRNHGLLSIKNRPTWRVIKGGSKSYIEPLIQHIGGTVVASAVVTQVKRETSHVAITVNGAVQKFDEVIFACHSDEALQLLSDGSGDELSVLGDIGYRENSVVLHTDQKLLPRRKKAWSSWNYLLSGQKDALPILTYNMNILQGIEAPTEFCVTLNAKERIDPSCILGEYRYSHPVFTGKATKAQARWQSINGVNRTWFCGAYWFNGFHEDGVKSAKRVAETLMDRAS